MKYLVDSNIIIYHLNKDSIATTFLSSNYEQIAISQITFVEVLSFSFSEEAEKDVRELLSAFEILDVTKGVSNQAIENRKLKKIKIPDNIIASTAMVNNLTLVTRNVKDFRVLDVEVLNPFD
ncbi:MAG: type II toxin-antitoxin system VapC family toxin [Sulfurovum sp.]|nr:type II toxin-antitoxin system VapC family toxin [Sulfurovum sp.]